VYFRKIYKLDGVLEHSMDVISKKRNELLIGARMQLSLSQKIVADYLKVSRGTVFMFENFKTYPSDKLQIKICKYFSKQGIIVSREELFPKEKYEGAHTSIIGLPKLENGVLVGARKKIGLSQINLSKILKLHVSVYSDYENLHRYPSSNHQKLISEYFIKNGINLLEEDIFPKELYAPNIVVSKLGSVESDMSELEFVLISGVDESKLPVDENEYLKERIQSSPENLASRMINCGRYLVMSNNEKKWVYHLSNKERFSLTEHYINGKTFEEIGVEMKVSGARAQQLANKGVKRLKVVRHKFYDDLGFDRQNKLAM
jgi:DNA-binding XRE family transcriptional regulator